MDSRSILLGQLDSAGNDDGVAGARQPYTAIRPLPSSTSIRPLQTFIPLLCKDRSCRSSYYLIPVSAVETPQAWWCRIRAMQSRSFAKKAVYFIAMRRECVKVATIAYTSNIDHQVGEIPDSEQRVHVHVQDIRVDNGLTTAYNSPSSLQEVEESAVEYLQDFVTNGPLDLTRPKLAIYIGREFSGKQAIAWAACAFLIASAVGIATGFIKRDWVAGLGIGLGLFGFFAAVQALMTWLVFSH